MQSMPLEAIDNMTFELIMVFIISCTTVLAGWVAKQAFSRYENLMVRLISWGLYLGSISWILYSFGLVQVFINTSASNSWRSGIIRAGLIAGELGAIGLVLGFWILWTKTSRFR